MPKKYYWLSGISYFIVAILAWLLLTLWLSQTVATGIFLALSFALALGAYVVWRWFRTSIAALKSSVFIGTWTFDDRRLGARVHKVFTKNRHMSLHLILDIYHGDEFFQRGFRFDITRSVTRKFKIRRYRSKIGVTRWDDWLLFETDADGNPTGKLFYHEDSNEEREKK